MLIIILNMGNVSGLIQQMHGRYFIIVVPYIIFDNDKKLMTVFFILKPHSKIYTHIYIYLSPCLKQIVFKSTYILYPSNS